MDILGLLRFILITQDNKWMVGISIGEFSRSLYDVREKEGSCKCDYVIVSRILGCELNDLWCSPFSTSLV